MIYDKRLLWELYSVCFFLIIFSGALTNGYYYLVGDSKINVGSYALFLAVAAIVIIAVIVGGSWQKALGGNILLVVLFAGLLLGGYYLFFFSEDQVVSLKASISFFFLPLCSLGGYVFCKIDKERAVNLLLLTGLLISSIGVFQFLAGMDVHHGWLVLHGEEVLGFRGIGWVRPTAWVGNTIFYSGLVFMLFIFSLCCYLFLGKKLAWISTIVLGASIYVAMSRYTLLAVICCAVVVSIFWVLLSDNRKITVWRLVSILVFLGVSVVLLNQYNSLRNGGGGDGINKNEDVGHSLAIDRFDPSSTYSKGSNQVHFSEINEAIKIIFEDRELLGWGSQGISAPDSIISDGIWFQFALEVGLWNAGFFLFWCVILTILVFFYSWKTLLSFHFDGLRDRRLLYVFVFSLPVLSYLAYIMIGGFVNSSLACRISYVVFWTMVGCFFSLLDFKSQGDDVVCRIK